MDRRVVGLGVLSYCMVLDVVVVVVIIKVAPNRVIIYSERPRDGRGPGLFIC